MIRGQLSPVLARKIRSQGTGIRFGADVLPPELQVHLANLSPQPTPEQQAPVFEPSRYGLFNNNTLNIGLVSTLVLLHPATTRVFLFIVNTHATQNLFVNFGANADAFIGVPIVAGFGFMGFDTVVPQDDIYLVGSGANTTGVLTFCNRQQ